MYSPCAVDPDTFRRQLSDRRYPDGSGTLRSKIKGVTPNLYKKGDRCFTPSEGLDFVRQRDLLADNDFDYGRQRHQQQFLKAVLKQAVSDGFNSPTKLPGLLSAPAVAADNAPYKVVEGNKVDAQTLSGWRTWRCDRRGSTAKRRRRRRAAAGSSTMRCGR